jgi:hypothetical protein
MSHFFHIHLILLHLAFAAAAQDAPMKGIQVVYTAPSPSAAAVQAALAAEAHAVALQDFPATPETLTACLAAARNQLYVDLVVTADTWSETLDAITSSNLVEQCILSSSDLSLLRTIRRNNAQIRLRLCSGEAADAATLVPAVLTLRPGQISSGIQRACRKMGVALWLDGTGTPGDAVLDEAMSWEADQVSGVDFPRCVNRLREEGYYAARMLGRNLPVPPGTSLSLVGTRWKRGKHVLVFKEPPLLIVKGGIIDRLFLNGISGEYALAADGTVNIRVKGREGHGIFDGTYLATDGVECVRLNE